MNEKISIIVPVYKVEKYLGKCVNSILNQTYQNLEVILVDDGSPDTCPEICDKFASQDKRIRVIHKKNSGLSGARNSALEVVTGSYVGFVDSDDFIHETMYEVLYHNIQQYNADIAICSYKELEEGKEDFYVKDEIIEVWNREEAMEHLYQGTYFGVVAWNKLYKKEIVKSIRFPEGCIYEDEYMIHRILDLSEKVVFSSKDLYYYLQREGGIIRSEFSEKRLDILGAYIERYQLFSEKYSNKLQELSFRQYMERSLRLAFQARYYGKREVYKKVKAMYKDFYQEHINEIELKNHKKLKYFLINKCFLLNFPVQCFEIVMKK